MKTYILLFVAGAAVGYLAKSTIAANSTTAAKVVAWGAGLKA